MQCYTPGSGIKVAVIYWPCVRQVVACAYIYGVVKAHTERIITEPSNRPVSNCIKMMNILFYRLRKEMRVGIFQSILYI